MSIWGITICDLYPDAYILVYLYYCFLVQVLKGWLEQYSFHNMTFIKMQIVLTNSVLGMWLHHQPVYMCIFQGRTASNK